MKKRVVSGKKQRSGWEKVKLSGAVCVMLTMRPEERDTVRRAAAITGRAVANFIKFYALEAARDVLTRDYNSLQERPRSAPLS